MQSVDHLDALAIHIEGLDIIEGRYVNEETLNRVSQADGMIFGSPSLYGRGDGSI